MRINILCGGQAGQGPNVLASVISQGLVSKGFYVFCAREYESRIRGGHNFNVITFSEKPVMSNDSKIDVLFALDEKTAEIHKKELGKNAIVVKEEKDNIIYAGRAFKLLGLDFSILEGELKEMRNFENNIVLAKKGFETERHNMGIKMPAKKAKISLINGSRAVADGAIGGGLEFYYAYPMTPATGVLFELASEQGKHNYKTIELESEIAVINAAIGSAITGAKAMAGSSGGGFDLMTEALSMTGVAGIPVVMYLAQRAGPGTGAATLTGQGDLNMARHAGHGEFLRVVSAAGDSKDATELTSQMFYFTQKYRIPGILMSDKHLAESIYSMDEKAKIMQSEKSIKWPARFNSYESGKDSIFDDSVETMNKNAEKRIANEKKMAEEIDKLFPIEIHGKKNSKNLIIGWGSTKGAIIDSIEFGGLDCAFLQIKYLEPFSVKVAEIIKKYSNVIIVENNATSPLSSLIAEKSAYLIEDKNKILKYDGRPFLMNVLSEEIKRRLK